MVQKFCKPAVEVEALQFHGLTNLQEIFEWLHGIIFINQGQDNEFRRPDEYGDELEVKRDAPSFGIIQTRSGYDRIDIGDWVVKFDEEHVIPYEPMEFAMQFESVET